MLRRLIGGLAILALAGIPLFMHPVVVHLLAQSAEAVAVKDSSGLVADVIQTAVILAVAAAVIRMFFTFKDETGEKISESERKLVRLSDALLGIDGRGGLLTDRELDQKRRHDLNNHVHRLTLVVAEILRIQTEMGRRLDIAIDPNLSRALERPEHER